MDTKPNLIHKFVYLLIKFLYFSYLNSKKIINKFEKNMTLNELIEIKNSEKLTKKNNHTSIIINLEDKDPVKFKDLGKIISWLIILEIPYISIYEHNGKLIDNQETVNDHVLQYLSKFYQNLNLIKGDHPRSFILKCNNLNFKIRYICALDGKEKIVKVVNEVLQDKLNSKNNNSESIEENLFTNPNELTNKLFTEFKYPDPDLALIFSSIYNVYGYPPWEIRYTELIKYPYTDNINIKDFYDCLVKFNKTEQRKGK